MRIEERDHHLGRWSNSAYRSPDVKPGRRPVSRSAARTQWWSISGGAADLLCDRPNGRPWRVMLALQLNTIRTARSRTSGEYRLGLPMDSILLRNGASRKSGTVH